jgi:serine/threonine-protein kinase
MAVPERIGRYRILGELGRGAMGTVYRARDESLDREIALKVMSAGQADADARARFLREARAAAKLQHPNIVVVYELGEHEGAPFMALELLDGVDLQRGIDAGIRPDPRATLPVVLQLLAGLGHAHEKGVVHRDVKPSNVFLPRGLPAKVMDFGVARLAGLGTTTAGVVVGTPNYMSPEQAAAGGDVDGRSDLFSAGLILYELVTGEKAFQAETVIAVVYKILHEEPDLRLIPAGARWERLHKVLARALAKKRDERYPDARAMSADLALALRDLGGTMDLSAPADQALLVRPRPASPAQAAPATPVRPTAAPAPPPREPPRAVGPAPAPSRALRTAAFVLAAGAAALLAAAAWLHWRPAAAPAAVPATLSTPAAAGPTNAPGMTPTPGAPPAAAAPSAGPSPAASPRLSTPTATPPAAPTPAGAPAPAATVAVGLGPEARLARARDLFDKGSFAEALAETRAVLDAQPTNREASALAQKAEAELVIEECLRNARAALKAGDRERALEELRRGFAINPRDERLRAAIQEAMQQ